MMLPRYTVYAVYWRPKGLFRSKTWRPRAPLYATLEQADRVARDLRIRSVIMTSPFSGIDTRIEEIDMQGA